MRSERAQQRVAEALAAPPDARIVSVVRNAVFRDAEITVAFRGAAARAALAWAFPDPVATLGHLAAAASLAADRVDLARAREAGEELKRYVEPSRFVAYGFSLAPEAPVIAGVSGQEYYVRLAQPVRFHGSPRWWIAFEMRETGSPRSLPDVDGIAIDVVTGLTPVIAPHAFTIPVKAVEPFDWRPEGLIPEDYYARNPWG